MRSSYRGLSAKGIDILAYSQSGTQRILIQVKTLSQKNPVPMGNNLDNLMADFVVVCVRAHPNEPDCFVLTPSEIQQLAHKGMKNEKTSYWLQPKPYFCEQFKDLWHRIGTGAR